MENAPSGIEIEKLIASTGEDIDRVEHLLNEQFAKHPEWSEIILPFLASGQDRLVANARRLLCLFDTQALLTIARGFEINDATARFEILGVLWAHIIAMASSDRQEWLELVAPYLRPGLTDKHVPERGFADPERLELEHDYRICDETYLFLNRLLQPGFDDSRFALLDEEDRRAIIEQFDRRFDNLFGLPAVAARRAAKQPPALAEITIVASFPNAFQHPDTQEERDKAKLGKWAPADRDFIAVAEVDTPNAGKAIFKVHNFLEMLSVILFVDPAKPDSSAFRPAQSVKRVNIITHGNLGLIAMSGTVDTNGRVLLTVRGPNDGDLTGPIDDAAVQAASDTSLLLANGKPLTQSLRDRLASDAEIYLLACRSGMAGSLPLMQGMKNLFKAKICAFTKEIAYCPSLDAKRIIDRAFTAIGDCNSGSTRGFKHLVPDKTF